MLQFGVLAFLSEEDSDRNAKTPAKEAIAVRKGYKKMALRRAHRRKLENKLLHGPAWEDSGFVFTDELGHHLKHQTVYLEFKKIVTEIGSPNARFHDLRLSFAVSSSVPEMILRLYRNFWAMLPRHSPWMFMVMSPTKCIKKVQFAWTGSLRMF